MGRLFWRIFLSFGAAMIVILVIAIGVSFRLASQVFEDEGVQGRTAAVREAASALEHNGRDGLEEWLRNNPRLGPRRVLFVIDERGEELLGRPLPRRMRLLLRPQPRRDLPPPPGNFRPSRFVPQLVGADGSTYRLVTAPLGPSRFGILGWPTARLVWLITAVMVAGLVSFLLARYITAPIGRLQAASRALAAGRLDTRLGDSFARRHDEIAALAQDFDRMAAQLEHLITQREILLRDISHELRSPLTRLRMALALAQRRDRGESSEDLKRIEMEAERLENLIGQVLDLARIDAAGDQSERQTVELLALVDQVVADATYEHPAREIRWQSRQSCKVLADPHALTSAIENVVRNALAHSAPDQAVEISLEVKPGDSICLYVRDQGPGVPEEDLERIFEPFFQVDKSRGHERGGFGVGLAISARITRLHGGDVMARNRDPGGLELCITLPVDRSA